MKRQIGWQDYIRAARRLEDNEKIVLTFKFEAGRFHYYVRYDDERAQPFIAMLLEGTARGGGNETGEMRQ